MEIKIPPVKEIEVTQVGSTFEFPFDYLRKGFVHTTVNDEDEDARSFTIVGKSIVFDEPLQIGDSLKIFRSTPTTPLVSWADASVLKAKDMTIQQVQELHILEEEDYRFQGIEDRVDDLVDTAQTFAVSAENSAIEAGNKATDAQHYANEAEQAAQNAYNDGKAIIDTRVNEAENAANNAKEQADRAIQGFPADNSITAFKLSPSLGQKSGVSANTANAMCECLMTYIAKSADGTFSYQQNNKAINYSISDETVVASQGIDCTTTMTLVIGGCPYEQSRYCAGNDKNHFKAMGYGYDFYEGKDYETMKYSWLWQIANRMFEKGYYISIQDEAGNINYKGLQPGDILIWCNTTAADDSRIQPINFAKANDGQDLWAKHTDFVIGTCGDSVLVGDGGQIPIQVHEARKLSYCDYVFAFRVPLGEGVPTNINCKSMTTNSNADSTENNGQMWTTALATSEILRYTPVAAVATVNVTTAGKTIKLYQGPNSSSGYSELLGNASSYTTTEADVGKTITVRLMGFTNIFNANHGNMGIRVMSTNSGKLIAFKTSYPATYVDEARCEKRLYAATTGDGRLAPKRLLDMKTDGTFTVSTAGYLLGGTVGKCEFLNSTHMLTKDYTRDIVWELIDNEWYPIDVKLKGVGNQLCPIRFKPPSGTICHFEFVAANLAFVNTSGSSSEFSTFAQAAFKNSSYRKYEGYISNSALTMFATHIGGTDKTIYKVKYDFETSTWSLLA